MANIKTKPSRYDLEERTVKFAENVIDIVRFVKIDAVNKKIIEQLIGSSGSVGANYCEATEAESKKDFAHKMGICKKELKETKHWLRLLARSNPDLNEGIKKMWKEAHELLLISAKSIRTSRGDN